ncbi:hypothetical protein F4561_001204 [Lipingzhangella halophila]|uniref:Uncharacterized protein n=1 Tax=Lipingzhangella halophila TaxID=1783352 RepID=A0A7W7REF4_9ACTN|nr:hypothetical protein [Lipingzhangella halophila]MBB4930384.1 hypothetical protein [Lipingzhangella halophila]
MKSYSPPFFTKPAVEGVPLRLRPRLASWERGGHPDQVRLEEYLVHVQDILRTGLEQTPDPLALWLDVGLPRSVALLEHHDLDNYLFPLVSRLSKHSGRQFASVWCTKRHAESSRICLSQARPATDRPLSGRIHEVATNASSQSAAYKQQIAEQLGNAPRLPDGAISLQLGFCVGPRRGWANLWKPTIDALDGLLGRTSPARQWHPRDDRIVELGLHCRIDQSLGNEVLIRVEATSKR